jgi:hypothetical protein
MNNHQIAGFLGGMTGAVIAHPIDTIRVRYQTINYPNIMETVKDTYKQSGIRGFYRGLMFPMVGISIEKSIVFSGYHYFKNLNLLSFNNISNYDNNLNHPEIKNWKNYVNIGLSGFITGLLTTTVMSPIEVLKTHFQHDLKNSNITSKLKNITNGYLATTLRESIGYATYFLTYEFCEQMHKDKKLIPLYGGLSALMSWGIIYPFDLVKNIKIIEPHKTYKEIIDGINKSNGIKGFYRGFGLAQLRAIPYHSAVWTGYKYSKEFLDHYRS